MNLSSLTVYSLLVPQSCPSTLNKSPLLGTRQIENYAQTFILIGCVSEKRRNFRARFEIDRPKVIIIIIIITIIIIIIIIIITVYLTFQ